MSDIAEIEHQHSTHGPSGAPRWTTCLGSVEAEKGMPDVPSIYAATGTLYHAVLAECLQWGFDPEQYLGRWYMIDGFEFVFGECEDSIDMPKHMRRAIDEIYEQAEGNELFIETRVDISPFTLPGQFGTTDVAIASRKDRTLIIRDHKYGEGVAVSPIENKQSMLYALGFWNTMGWQIFAGIDPADISVRIIIDQPRARIHDADEEGEAEAIGGGEWNTTMKELLEKWGPYFALAAAATQHPNAPRTASEAACRFCKAKLVCKTRAEYTMDQIGLTFEVIDEMQALGVGMTKAPDPKSMSQEQRCFIAANKDFMIRWLQDMHHSVLLDGLQGEPTPGLKIVRGRQGPRAWGDSTTAEKLLTKWVGSAKAFTKKLITPTAAEELITKEQYAKLVEKKLVTQSEGKASLVSDTDPREALQTVIDTFEVIGEGVDSPGDNLI